MRVRILSALVAAPVAVFLILWPSPPLFALLVMLLMVCALWEWNQLTLHSPTAFVGAALGMMWLGLVLHWFQRGIMVPPVPVLLPWVCVLGCLLWAWQGYALLRGVACQRSPRLEFWVGVSSLFCAWAGLVWLRGSDTQGGQLVLIAVMVIWAADTFAYFVGRSVGQCKLAPSISPAKTVEGVAGGLAGALLVAWIGGHFFRLSESSSVWPWLAASAAAALVSVIGDLSVSRLKRQAGVKDTGNVLPGHGGLLDRMDGLLPAMPLFGVIWWCLK